MQVIPAIDILDGKVVRLVRGDFVRVTVFGDDPLEIAQSYLRAGATRLHLVNLSAARDGRGDGRFLDLVSRLSRDIEVQVGGGIRDLPAIVRCSTPAPPRWWSERCSSLSPRPSDRPSTSSDGQASSRPSTPTAAK